MLQRSYSHSLIICQLLLAVFLLIGAGVIPAQAQQGPATIIHPDPLVFEVGLGQIETLTIVLENAQEVYGIDVRARFDPKAVEIADADPAKTGIEMIPGKFIKPDFLVYNTADNQNGTLMYVITQVNPSQPVNGSGVVISILVQGKVLGESDFTIDFIQMSDRQGKLLPVTPQSGKIKVVPPKPVTPTPPAPAPTQSAATADPGNGQAPAGGGTTGQPTSGPKPTIATGLTPSASNTAPADPGSSSRWLVWIAAGTFLGAAILLLLAAILFFRKSPGRNGS